MLFIERYGLLLALVSVTLVAAVYALLLRRYGQRKLRASEMALRQSNLTLEDVRASIDAQIETRTADLRRRSELFQTAASVSRRISGFRDTEHLIPAAVSAISSRFGFYHAGIYLADDAGEGLVLVGASSEDGNVLLASGDRTRVGPEGTVASAYRRGEASIDYDVGSGEPGEDAQRLPQTRSEIAVPLRLQERIIGILDVQSEEPGAFSREDIEVFEIVADQLAIAIDNARALMEHRLDLDRLDRAHDSRLEAAWRRSVSQRAFSFDGLEVRPVAGSAAESLQGKAGRLVVPIPLRGQVIGTIVLDRDPEKLPWSPEERALARAMGVQAGLSLDSAQVLNETQLRARREQLLAGIASSMRQTLDMDLILQTALREMGQNLGISDIEIRMSGGDGE
jgi:GAF domain-containing protein